MDRYAGAAQFNDQPIGIACSNGGDVYVVGKSCDSIGASFSLYSTVILKYSSSGGRQWTVTYTPDDTLSAIPSDFSLDDSDNVVITGYVQSTHNYWWNNNFRSLTMKYNWAGILQWSTFDSGPHTQGTVGMRTATDHAGNIYVVGLFGGYSWSYGADSLSLCKYGPGGRLQWTSVTNDTDRMVLFDVALDAAGSPYVTWAAAPSYGYEKYYAIVTALFSAYGDERSGGRRLTLVTKPLAITVLPTETKWCAILRVISTSSEEEVESRRH